MEIIKLKELYDKGELSQSNLYTLMYNGKINLFHLCFIMGPKLTKKLKCLK